MRWKRAITLVSCIAAAGSALVPWLCPPVLWGDANGDRAVNVLDIQCVITALLTGTGGAPAADVNGDGRLDVLDYQALLGQANAKGKPAPRLPKTSDQPIVQAVLCASPASPLPLCVAAIYVPPCDGKGEPVDTAPFLFSHRLKHERYVLGLRSHAPPAPC